MPLIPLTLLNINTGEPQEALIDPNEVVSITTCTMLDNHNIIRELRGKTVTTINFRSGMVHWTNVNFSIVAANILEARAQIEDANEYRKRAAAERRDASPLAV